MRSATKDNLKMSIILILTALILFPLIYNTCTPPKITGMITSDTRIIDNRYLEAKKSEGYMGEDIAVKIDDGKKQYLMVYRGPSLTECRYDMNKKDFDSLQVDKRYWFSVKLYKKNNTDSGKIERVYTENPVR